MKVLKKLLQMRMITVQFISIPKKHLEKLLSRNLETAATAQTPGGSWPHRGGGYAG